MICKACADAADHQSAGLYLTDEEIHVGHTVCGGCDCQHKNVKEGQVKRA